MICLRLYSLLLGGEAWASTQMPKVNAYFIFRMKMLYLWWDIRSHCRFVSRRVTGEMLGADEHEG